MRQNDALALRERLYVAFGSHAGETHDVLGWLGLAKLTAADTKPEPLEDVGLRLLQRAALESRVEGAGAGRYRSRDAPVKR